MRAAATIPIRCARHASPPHAGADGITAHLREDRRHITDNDIDRLMAEIDLPLNLEMAATEEMLEIALRHKPHAACIVPERREERTTEGGLDAAGQRNHLAYFVESLSAANIRVSLFIEPAEEQVAAAVRLGAPVVEFHTGRYAHAEWRGTRRRAQAHCRLRGAGGQERDRAARRPRIDVRQCCPRRRHPAGRRAQHRPFPDRRGDLHRARRQRSSNARADGFGEMSHASSFPQKRNPASYFASPKVAGRRIKSGVTAGGSRHDRRHRFRPVQHRADRKIARRAGATSSCAAFSPRSNRRRPPRARSPAPERSPSASRRKRPLRKRSARGSGAVST